MSLLFKLTYGLYMLSVKDEQMQNGAIINTVMQQTALPEVLTVTLNNDNLTTKMLKETKKCVVNILSEKTTFSFIKTFGMQRGSAVDKFKEIDVLLAKNGVITNKNNSVGYLELQVEKEIAFSTHTMFVCKITNSVKLQDEQPLTYAYYHSNVKEQVKKAESEEGEQWLCKICNYVHKGSLPDDIICPLCKHGKEDFVKL